jgi:hypothetical protein
MKVGIDYKLIRDCRTVKAALDFLEKKKYNRLHRLSVFRNWALLER